MFFPFISAAFCIIVLLSNIISVKLVTLPFSSLAVPVGLFTYPLTFLLTDFVTEIFGAKKARQMVYMALATNILSLGMLQVALLIPAHDAESEKAFQYILGLSGLRILSSLVAFLTAQIVGIQLYTWLKRWTGEKFLWMRNNGANWVSQAVDTVVVDMICLYAGLGMSLGTVTSIIGFAYTFKVFFSIATTPLLYLFIFLFRKNARAVSHYGN